MVTLESLNLYDTCISVIPSGSTAALPVLKPFFPNIVKEILLHGMNRTNNMKDVIKVQMLE